MHFAAHHIVIASAITLLLATGCSPSSAATVKETEIPLDSIIHDNRDSFSEEGGYFIELENNSIVFFNLRQWRALYKLIESKGGTLQNEYLVYNPARNKSITRNLPVHLDSSGKMSFDGINAVPASLERVRLTFNWHKVLNHPWPQDSTVTQLDRNRFLIAGGMDHELLIRGHLADFCATIFDAATDSSTPTGKLNIQRMSHAAALLSNGTVLIAGGEPVVNGFSAKGERKLYDSLEIFDPKTGRFRLLQCKLNTPRRLPTICIGAKCDAYIIGGLVTFAQKSIERFDEKTETVSIIGDMKIARFFSTKMWKFPPRSAVCMPIEQGASRLPSGKYLVCGGGRLEPKLFCDFAGGPANSAAILELP